MAPLVITALSGVRLFINDSALARNIVYDFLTSRGTEVMQVKNTGLGRRPCHDRHLSNPGQAGSSHEYVSCNDSEFCGEQTVAPDVDYGMLSEHISDNLAAEEPVRACPNQHIAVQCADTSDDGYRPEHRSSDRPAVSSAHVGTAGPDNQSAGYGHTMAPSDVIEELADKFPERVSNVKTAAETPCSSGLKGLCSEHLGSFQTDPEVPMSVKRGLDDLFSKVADVDSKLTNRSSTDDPTAEFYKTLLLQNPNSKLARRYFQERR